MKEQLEQFKKAWETSLAQAKANKSDVVDAFDSVKADLLSASNQVSYFHGALEALNLFVKELENAGCDCIEPEAGAAAAKVVEAAKEE